MCGHVECERGLAHCRAGAHDDQCIGLQAGQQLVEIDEAGGSSGDALAIFVELLEAVESGVEQVANLAHRVGHATLGDLKHHVLCLIDGSGDIVGEAVADLCNLTPHRDQTSQGVTLGNYLGVFRGV